MTTTIRLQTGDFNAKAESAKLTAGRPDARELESGADPEVAVDPLAIRGEQLVDASAQVGDGLHASVRHYAGLANEAAHCLTYLPLPISGLDRRTNT